MSWEVDECRTMRFDDGSVQIRFWFDDGDVTNVRLDEDQTSKLASMLQDFTGDSR
jgi:hypothetical protein